MTELDFGVDGIGATLLHYLTTEEAQTRKVAVLPSKFQ